MKHRILQLLVTILCFMQISCTITEETKSNWSVTGHWATKKAFDIATRIVLNVAVSQLDKENKADLLDSSATALRSVISDNVITSADVKFLLDTWTPDKPHWNSFAEAFYKDWASSPPKTAQEARARLEAYARGLQQAASEARE